MTKPTLILIELRRKFHAERLKVQRVRSDRMEREFAAELATASEAALQRARTHNHA